MTIRRFAGLILVFLAGFGIANRSSPRPTEASAEDVPRTIHVTHPGRLGTVHAGTPLVVVRALEDGKIIYERTSGQLTDFLPVWKVALGKRVYICVEMEN